MKTTSLFLLLGIVFFATGCPKSKPNVPPVVARRLANYEVERFEKEEAAYNTAAEGNQSDQARRLRDRIIYRLKTNIDANYQDFENQLFTSRARTNILFDITEIGTSVAINITNGERAKSIIAAALTGFKGGRKSIDENLFMERTTQVIISQMQASRSRVEETLLTSMRDKGVDEYPLEAALGDLINYFYAGSLQKGLQELAKETGRNAIEAEGRVLQLKGVSLSEPVTDEADLADPREAVKTLGTLNTLLIGGTAEQRAEALAKLQSIFAALEGDEETLRIVHDAATGVTSEETDGAKLITALRAIARRAGNAGPVRAKINRIIIDKGKL
jgi:hypothetical protein